MEKIFYPLTQRRLRVDAHIRELTASVKLSHKSFIQPLFVDEAITEPRLVNGLNGVEVDTLHSVLKTIEECIAGGINKFLLFPVPAKKVEKDFDFSFAVSVIKNIRQAFGNDVWLAADLCLCSYTTHGHCGILSGIILNSSIIKQLMC
jgi:porphobilinogen synthase